MSRNFIWEKSYPDHATWLFKASHRPAHHIFEDTARRYPERICMNFFGMKQTYAQTMDLMHRVAAGLQESGIQKGDRVGLCLPNTPYYIASYFAILKIGAIVVNFNPLYTEDELRYQIENSGIKMMMTIDVESIYHKIHNLLGTSSFNQLVACSLSEALPKGKKILYRLFKRSEMAKVHKQHEVIPFKELINHGKDITGVSINPDTDTAIFQYTGGTTGTPKAAMLSHKNIVANTEQILLWRGHSHKVDKFLAAIPFFHVFSMTAVMNFALATGSEIIMLPRFDLKQVLKIIQKDKPTIFPGVPTIFAAIGHKKGIEHLDLTSLDFCISGGASLPASVRQAFEAQTGGTLVEGYGLSEASPVLTCNPCNLAGKAGSIGLPLPGTEIEIRDFDHLENVVKIGEKGEIFARGPQIMQGYYAQSQETAKTLMDGWLRTGDVGYMDEDGYVFLTDRLKDIIIVNGYNVYPHIIEDAFYKHEAVEEVIVIGIPDDEKGEAPKAFVKLKEGVKITEKELLAFAAKHLNPIEKPKSLEFRAQLPKTLIGKLSKKELKAEVLNKK